MKRNTLHINLNVELFRRRFFTPFHAYLKVAIKALCSVEKRGLPCKGEYFTSHVDKLLYIILIDMFITSHVDKLLNIILIDMFIT